MDVSRRYQLSHVALALVTVAHALATWPLRRTAALFVGGAALAFVLEVIGLASGLLEHELRPQVAGVPLSIVLAWPAIVYLAYRAALLVAPAGVAAAGVAAVVATAFDVLTDPSGVEDGAWRYPESALSSPRYRGVPWWNFVVWLVVVFATAMLPTLAGG